MQILHLQAVDTWGTIDVLVNNAGTAKCIFCFATIPICFTSNNLKQKTDNRNHTGHVVDENEEITVARCD